MLLVGETTVVRVDLRERRAERLAIGVAPGESCWGLAKLADGSLWSLKGRNAIIRIEPDGRVSRTVQLNHPHIGLMAARRSFDLSAGHLGCAGTGAAGRRAWR